MPVPTLSADGLLPLGRYSCSMAEVESAFGTATAQRQTVWDHFVQATDLLRSVVPVNAVWLGGSFTTAKADPDDVDVTYLFQEAAYAGLSAADQRLVSIFGRAQVRAVFQLSVDTHLIPWVPADDVVLSAPEYALWRGYWDDWWQRHRVKGVPASRDAAIPARGYLEVALDDYVV